jgi:endonuclease/exonuclease/phosphatase (EEP) superfamily protein YafD
VGVGIFYVLGELAVVFSKIFRATISIAAVLTGLAVLFSFLASWYPAADSVAHFRFHLTAIMLLIAVLLMVLRNWRSAGLSLAVSAAAIAGMAPAFPAWEAAIADSEAPTIKIVQLNLSYRNTTPDAVADFIRGEQADIVTLQEVTGKTARVVELLAEDYPYRVSCAAKPVGGQAVLSRLPMAPGQSEGCTNGRGMVWMRVVAGGQQVTVASLHLHWPYPFEQGRQIDRLEDMLKDLPRPVLLAGDFNAAPWSHAVDRIAKASDTSIAGGLRFSFDIKLRDWTPPIAMPIDHILLPDGVTPLEVRVGPGPGSDHRSLVARLALPAGVVQDQAKAPSAPASEQIN